jgi:general stress protein 26
MLGSSASSPYLHNPIRQEKMLQPEQLNDLQEALKISSVHILVCSRQKGQRAEKKRMNKGKVHNLYFSPNITAIKSKKTGWV